MLEYFYASSEIILRFFETLYVPVLFRSQNRSDRNVDRNFSVVESAATGPVTETPRLNFSSKWHLSKIISPCWKQMYITLWGSNMLFVYYKPRKCEHMRYCHLELILLITLFLGGMFAQTRSTFIKELFIAHLIGLVWVRNSWCGFPQIHISISYLGNRLLQVILIIAVRDCVTSWSYQESLSVHST